MRTIDRIEREARADRRFHDLLRGVWYYRASDELRTRLDALGRPEGPLTFLLAICTSAPQFRFNRETLRQGITPGSA
ncbi:hypothetical protein QA640_05100 [Bradyrhizobium sp. CB82]|uniref:DUF6869 domain-containing protein n=1 Tax=Bradyrhizobium sp. CB82 TaxID=3039159 RepID=UPI0024B050D6|nr:hypothetical protein [Bradyrhizobium sp. CB82]WFU41878.1 hypothetical protein QA640_05100 [Bradyrhizobium sp. CB82]